MNNPSRSRTGGAIPTALSGQRPAPAASRRRPDSTAVQLERMSAKLDELIYSVRLGTVSQRKHDEHIAQAEAIAAGIRETFRGPAAEPVHPPLWQSGGKAIW